VQYREALAVDDWQRLDPISRLAALGAEQGWLGEEQAAALERDAREEVEAAVAFARASPYPPPELVGELVYKDGEA
jgi:acetoin:2,6-dichlorophenolindophenol oxidoreductase subunit alpha